MNLLPPYLTRFELDEDEEREDGFLYASGRGRAGEARKGVLQPQQFGCASRPPSGSVGLKMAMGGQHSTPMLVGSEHPGHRPKMGIGHSVLYDAFGQVVSVVERDVRIVANEKFVVVAPMIVFESSDIRLGGEDASKPVGMEGSLDTDNDALNANLSTVLKTK